LNLPPEVMKMNQPLIVPIAKQAINLIKELHQFNRHSKYMFCQSHDPRKYMSENTVNQALKRMGYKGKQTAHGFRHIASTHLNEMGYRFDLIEKQMAHGEKDEVRAAYNKAEWIPERTEMMQTWANYIDSLADDQNNVVTGKFKTTKARA
ncbi:MAG: site-specific integrase, partial [Gammaproteobacteria bacterium]|nr:site-specific integrase [Gammaproteobacteria bacterium]